jgi:uncharacterized protein (DUF849 family)
MDTNDLVAQARSRFDHAAARRVLKEKYEAKMLFAHAGGMFKSTPEMITFLSLYSNEEIVLLDLYDTPVKVNADHLKDEMQKRWYEQMNAWLIEHEELSRQR